jgi:predicted ABC-type ATPase
VAADSRLDLAERERLRQEQPQFGLEQRLARLPDGHPSGEGYEHDGDGGRPERIRPLTDAEYAEHITYVEAKLETARAAGLATDVQHTIDSGREVWSEERLELHDDILQTLYADAEDVPCEHRALIAGGLAGSGKTTVLGVHIGADSTRYLTINPDIIKEEMARRGAIPDVDGLSPMEASDLVHEESSYLARRLGNIAMADGRNLIWDITMSSGSSAEKRVTVLRSAGYSEVEGIFVDIPVELSLQRAASRHREGHDEYRAGEGLGGRYVPPALILDQADEVWGSCNRKNFEDAKGSLDRWFIYDNSQDRPRLMESGPLRNDRDVRDVT